MSKLVLILNCGSSSLKFAVMDAQTGDSPLTGLAECFNLDDARIKWKLNGQKGEAALGAGAAHQAALDFLVKQILPQDASLGAQLVAIGHRIVHGGEQFAASVRIDDSVIAGIEAAIPFAPLHNPAGLIGINAAMQVFPQLCEKNVAVFDTAFHQTLPQEAYLYALPYALYRDHGIRRYGAHGTSHRFIAEEVAAQLGKPLNELNIINCHLGNGASVCAIKNGVSVDTSMGLTPLEGLMMGTRSGDIDPAIIFHLHDNLGMAMQDINTLLTKQSGLLGLSEVSNDGRHATGHYATDPRAKRALDVFTYRVAKYIGSYMAALDGRLDALVFTGGIGENSVLTRAKIVERLRLFGFALDSEANERTMLGEAGPISTASSRLALVVPTNEELVIARDALTLVA
ncbi:MAG: acetate kinase [Aeromonas sp.]